MRLLPREQDRLLLFLAAELARKRRGRGLRLNQAEAVALIADEVCEAARDGRSYAEAEAAGYALLGPGDVAEGVAALVRRWRSRRCSPTAAGCSCCTTRSARPGRRAQAEAAIEWLARERAVTVVNEGAVPVGVTSHFHFFEVNRALRFERAAAWGMRLAIAPGREGLLRSRDPAGGVPAAVRRRARDPRPRRPGRRAAGRRTARSRPRWRSPASGGTAVPEPGAVRLADSDLWLVPEADDAGGPDRILPGFGNTMRDGLGVRAERGGVELAIVGGLVADPVLGVRHTSLGIAGGRIVAIGRAGNPDTMDGIEVVLDTATSVVDATGMIVTPGGVDPHVHWLSPQVAETALAGGLTTLVIQDYGPIWNLGTNPAEGLAATWAALEAHAGQRRAAGARLVGAPRPGRAARCARAAAG